MLKKYVFNAHEEIYLKTINRAIDRAAAEGYRFMQFNGIIYFIDENGGCHDTGLKEIDIVD